MSTEVREELDRIDQNIVNTYNVLEEAGAEMPQTRNSNNLPETAASISAVLYGREQVLTPEQQEQARKNIGIAGNGGQSDWNATEEDPGYIKNRTHYSEYEVGLSFIPQEITFSEGLAVFDARNLADPGFTVGELYLVTFNGEKYYSTAFAIEGYGSGVIGNPGYVGSDDRDNGQPFIAMLGDPGTYQFVTFEESLSNATVTVSIGSNIKEVVKQIPSKYIPTPNWGAAEGEPGYIEGRTHYKGLGTVMEERTVELELMDGVYGSNAFEFPDELFGMDVTGGEFYGPQEIIVTWNGIAYTSKVDLSLGFPAYGNMAMFGLPDTGEPYILVPILGTIISFESSSVTLKIECETYIPLDKKYLPKDVEYKTISSDHGAKVYDIESLYKEFTEGEDILQNPGVEWDTQLTEEQFLFFYDIASKGSRVTLAERYDELTLCGSSSVNDAEDYRICYFYVGKIRVTSNSVLFESKYIYFKWYSNEKKVTRYNSSRSSSCRLHRVDTEDPTLTRSQINTLIDEKLNAIGVAEEMTF